MFAKKQTLLLTSPISIIPLQLLKNIEGFKKVTKKGFP